MWAAGERMPDARRCRPMQCLQGRRPALLFAFRRLVGMADSVRKDVGFDTKTIGIPRH